MKIPCYKQAVDGHIQVIAISVIGNPDIADWFCFAYGYLNQRYNCVFKESTVMDVKNVIPLLDPYGLELSPYLYEIPNFPLPL